jgi:hypothetical protein
MVLYLVLVMVVVMVLLMLVLVILSVSGSVSIVVVVTDIWNVVEVNDGYCCGVLVLVITSSVGDSVSDSGGDGDE